MKLVIYTAIFGDYDIIKPIPKKLRKEIKFVCFTNIKGLRVEGWDVHYVVGDFDNNILNNRSFKMLPHRYLEDYEYSVYIDANVRVIGDIRVLVEKYMEQGLIACPNHLSRSCLYDEAVAVIKKGKASKYQVNEQLKIYLQDGFPKNHGLHEMNVIIRKHSEPTVIKLMEFWWEQFNKYSKRDQLSFHYALWKTSQEVISMVENTRVVNPYYYSEPHKHDGVFYKIRRKIKVIYQLYFK